MTNQRRIRLAIIQPLLAPYWRPVFEILAACPDIDFTLYALRDSLPDRPDWKIGGSELFKIEVLNVPLWPIKGKTPGNRTILGYRFIPTTLPFRLWQRAPDVIICSDLMQFLFSVPLKIRPWCHIGLLVEDTPLTHSLYLPWRQKVRKTLIRSADFWLPMGRTKVRHLENIGVSIDRVVLVPWSVDDRLFFPSTRCALFSKATKTQWISVGRLIPGKGFAELIRAWSKQSPSFLASNILLIVGKGQEKGNLITLINDCGLVDCVSIIEYNTPEELSRLYQGSDVFVFPTLVDTWGLVVNEAMTSGLPILCSIYAGCHPDLVSSQNGVVFDPLDAGAFASAIAGFSALRDTWPKMGQHSLRIISQYTPRDTATAIASAVKRIARSGCPNLDC